MNPETVDYCSFCPSKVKFIDVIVLMISIPMSDSFIYCLPLDLPNVITEVLPFN